jgi:hypothetical protein
MLSGAGLGNMLISCTCSCYWSEAWIINLSVHAAAAWCNLMVLNHFFAVVQASGFLRRCSLLFRTFRLLGAAYFTPHLPFSAEPESIMCFIGCICTVVASLIRGTCVSGWSLVIVGSVWPLVLCVHYSTVQPMIVRPRRSHLLFYSAEIQLKQCFWFSRLDELNLVPNRLCRVGLLFQLFSGRSEQLWSTPITGWLRQGGRKSHAEVEAVCRVAVLTKSYRSRRVGEEKAAAARRVGGGLSGAQRTAYGVCAVTS